VNLFCAVKNTDFAPDMAEKKEKMKILSKKWLCFGKKSYFCSRIPKERNRWWV